MRWFAGTTATTRIPKLDLWWLWSHWPIRCAKLQGLQACIKGAERIDFAAFEPSLKLGARRVGLPFSHHFWLQAAATRIPVHRHCSLLHLSFPGHSKCTGLPRLLQRGCHCFPSSRGDQAQLDLRNLVTADTFPRWRSDPSQRITVRRIIPPQTPTD